MCSKRKWSSERSASLILPYSELIWDNCSVPSRFNIHGRRSLGSPFRKSICAFEIRQNGDVYIQGVTVPLATFLNSLPKFVSITQAEYDALTNKDGNTVYMIKD
jgi:hypothetical protein